jgi:hypothetical protein
MKLIRGRPIGITWRSLGVRRGMIGILIVWVRLRHVRLRLMLRRTVCMWVLLRRSRHRQSGATCQRQQHLSDLASLHHSRSCVRSFLFPFLTSHLKIKTDY